MSFIELVLNVAKDEGGFPHAALTQQNDFEIEGG